MTQHLTLQAWRHHQSHIVTSEMACPRMMQAGEPEVVHCKESDDFASNGRAISYAAPSGTL